MLQLDRRLKTILQAQTQLEDLEECWLAGYETAEQEKAENANPYRKGSKEARFWNDGWWAGFYEEPKSFEQPAAQTETAHLPLLVAQNQPHQEAKKWQYWVVGAGLLAVGAWVMANQLLNVAA